MSALAPVQPPPAVPPAAAGPTAGGPTPWRWSHADYHRLGELGFFRGKRVQLIHGEVIEMSPIGWPHSRAVTRTALALQAAFAGVTAWVQSQNPLKVGGSEPEPDAAVIAGRVEDYADHPATALLVVEVSDSTLFIDTTTKAELYAAAGVADYWVLDLVSLRLRVLRDPRPLPPGGHAYQSETVLGPADSVSPLAAPNSAVRVADLLP